MFNQVAIDFEYKGTNEAKYDLVACCLKPYKGKVQSFWLHNNEEGKRDLVKALVEFRNNKYTFLSWNVVAEARSMISLGLEVTTMNWIDLQAEYKMLLNGCNRYAYGSQMNKEGKIVKTTPPLKYGEKVEGEKNSKPSTSLAAAMWKLLRQDIDLEKKNKMRDLILYTTDYSDEDKKNILDYCASDINDLFDLRDKIIDAYSTLPYWKYASSTIYKEMLYRGETVARSALMEYYGYPVNNESIIKFTNNVENILKECQEDINDQFPETFRWNNKTQRYSVNTQKQKDWIAQSIYESKWLRTKKDAYSLSLDAYEEHFSFRHDFPRNNFPAQILRFLKLKQSLNGFIPKATNKSVKDPRTFFDYYGSDNRAHPYLNPYGSQTGRYQPGSIGFIPLKAAWMRALIQPPKGKAICGIDYSSQEFLIGGLLADDRNMIESYRSGDVYLYFAKLAGAVPQDGTKQSHGRERDIFKAVVLGLSYGMGKNSLAIRLTDAKGEEVTPDEAQKYTDMFYKVYHKYYAWRTKIARQYRDDQMLKLTDGWCMFLDNPNHRSVLNFPVQGMGSVILRRAIKYAQEAGLMTIIPLHDALYIEYGSRDLKSIDTFCDIMTKAFIDCFDNKEDASLIRIDVKCWSPDYPFRKGLLSLPSGRKVSCSDLYIDERAVNEYEKFKKYL